LKSRAERRLIAASGRNPGEDLEAPVRPELLAASDDVIDDAVGYADPMVLRGLLYQLTGDPDLLAFELRTVVAGFATRRILARVDDVAVIRRRAADFLKAYRDRGAGPVSIGPQARLRTSLSLSLGEPVADDYLDLYLEELALDDGVRALKWRSPPDPERLRDFHVIVVGAAMGGLNAALQLKRAGIPYTLIEKNRGVGGTWYENRYPGARLDSPSRVYTHLFGVDFAYPQPFCEWPENLRYFDWVADSFGLRDDILFDTEVRSLAWDEQAGRWDVHVRGPGGERVLHARAVITAVGFLNRPNVPQIAGAQEFQGPSWHTSRWPQGFDLRGKRVAVIGTGATGYQMIPELALEAGHVSVFQRTAQWLYPVPGYRSPFPPQIGWLDRNLPFHTNFMRGGAGTDAGYVSSTTIDPDFADPHACSESNKLARDYCLAFLESKVADPALVAAMTPPHPVWSARVVMVDPEYSVLDAIQRDNVSLITEGIRRINRAGVETRDGGQHDVDAIVYATGFHATEYLFPMTVTGRDGQTLEGLWAEGGPRAYLGSMMPGFPNLWSLYGPNTNGALQVVAIHEMVTHYAMQCMERLILNGERAIEVKEAAYWRYARQVDEENNRKVWSDPRARSYYWSRHGRSVVQQPFSGPRMWRLLREPDYADLEVR
jgi:4-hydroxyacetophenone monooxygenase